MRYDRYDLRDTGPPQLTPFGVIMIVLFTVTVAMCIIVAKIIYWS